MATLQGVKDKVVVEVLEKEEKTEGGLILPENAQVEPQFYGEVASVGKDADEISVGDIVAFNERAGMDISLDKKKMKCIKVDEIYGILKK